MRRGLYNKHFKYYTTGSYEDVLRFEYCFKRLNCFEYKKDINPKFKGHIIKAHFDAETGDLIRWEEV